jgi:uncharacterized protein YjcR
MVTGIIDAMIKGGAGKVACAITYKAVVTMYSATDRARLKEAVEFVDDRIKAFKDSDLASYEDLARLVTSYADLTDKNEELIAEQSELITNYEKLVAKQQEELELSTWQTKNLYKVACGLAKLTSKDTLAKVKGIAS